VKQPRAILFDWDNTLVNTWPTITECYRDTFTALGQTPWTTEEVQARAHGSLRDHFPKLFGERAGEAERVFYETFHRIHLDRLEPLPGAADLLERCHVAGCYIDAKRDKPAPDPIYMALDGTGIAPDHDVWMVGDTPADLKCAHAAGVLPVLFGGNGELTELLREHPPRLHAANCHALAALL
jgi:phosphoglycolate phosphatase